MMPPQDAQDKERITPVQSLIYFSPPGRQPSPYRNKDVFANFSSVFSILQYFLLLLLKRKRRKNFSICKVYGNIEQGIVHINS